jgi:hypothetical protein
VDLAQMSSLLELHGGQHAPRNALLLHRSRVPGGGGGGGVVATAHPRMHLRSTGAAALRAHALARHRRAASALARHRRTAAVSCRPLHRCHPARHRSRRQRRIRTGPRRTS